MNYSYFKLKIRTIILITTSVVGSYMLVRGFSFIFGGFPNEFTIYHKLKNKEFDFVF